MTVTVDKNSATQTTVSKSKVGQNNASQVSQNKVSQVGKPVPVIDYTQINANCRAKLEAQVGNRETCVYADTYYKFVATSNLQLGLVESLKCTSESAAMQSLYLNSCVSYASNSSDWKLGHNSFMSFMDFTDPTKNLFSCTLTTP